MSAPLHHKLLLAAIIVCATLARPSSARAQPRTAQGQRAETQRQLDRAVALFEAQNYAAALGLFQDLYVRTRQPELLYNIGIAQERLGHRDEALRALREYLDRVPQSPNRAVVEEHIRSLAPPPTPAASPSPAPASIAPPPETVVHVRVRPLIPAAVIAGVGVVSFILAPVFWALRDGAISACTAQGNTLVCPTQADADQAADGRTYTALVDVAIGVGVAGVAAGALLYVFGGHDEVRHTHAAIHVLPTPGGVSIGITGAL